MLEIAAQPLFLNGFQRAVFIVMHGGQAVLDELAGDESHAVQNALFLLRRGELFPLADLVKGRHSRGR